MFRALSPSNDENSCSRCLLAGPLLGDPRPRPDQQRRRRIPKTDVCDGHVIGGANVEGRLASVKLGSTVDAARITIGLNSEAGFGIRSGLTAFSLTGGVPVALVSGPPSVRIAPFITPGIGFGRVSGNGDSVNGTRFMLGGGVTFQSMRTGVGATVGFQKAFIQNGETMLGVSLTLGAK